jgi:hypothetical protein
VMRFQIPFHDPRIESESVGMAARLKDHNHGESIDRIFEPAAEKTRAVCIR